MEEFLKEFQQTLTDAVQRLNTISPEKAKLARAPGKWTRKEILGHLIDSATNNHQRFVRVPLQAGVALPGYQQNDWVNAQHYQDHDWQQLVSLWHLYNLHLLHIVKYIPKEALQNTFNLNGETLGLEFVIRDYLRHMKHHLAQILEEPA
jgi:DinB superfamily